MDAADLAVRRHVYTTIASTGAPPSAAETAGALGVDEEEVVASYERLHEAHAIVLRDESADIRIANPFCFDPTPHRVTADGRTWIGTCCWDALGIPGAFHGDGVVDTVCACCDEPLRLEVDNGRLTEGTDLLAHILVSARHWWDDIEFT